MKTERIGVSIEDGLLTKFDKVIAQKGYKNRSEAIRDLIRSHLSDQQLDNPKTQAVAVVSLVYDHHATKLMQKLTALQHSHLLKTISSIHIHLAKHDCMEVIVLRGRVAEINEIGEKMLSLKGVKLGRINLVPM
ncbi:MAG: nickel-responsive transcriptional regulator NikR [Planctomycetota bacterium]|jgi:CopG family nickel-responsive transcriptional regulator